MYPLGHMALGYFSAEAVQRKIGCGYNLLIVWFLSILPDFDILIPNLLHRGPTHSIAAIILVLLISLFYNRKWLPYVASFASHALIGDLVTTGTMGVGSQLLWPFNRAWIGVNLFRMGSSSEIALEFILFLIMAVVLLNNARTVRALSS